MDSYISTCSLQPFPHIRNVDVNDALERGERLPQPSGCDEATYALLLRCWAFEPRQRPSFTGVLHCLHSRRHRTFVCVKTDIVLDLRRVEVAQAPRPTERAALDTLMTGYKCQLAMLDQELQEYTSQPAFTKNASTSVRLHGCCWKSVTC
jgi:hypothetical protein